jgi:8-oxo-dGTP diphosphatase
MVKRFEGPIVTVDTVVFRVDDARLKVLTIEREREPFARARALPGVYVSRDETLQMASDRCLGAKARFVPSAGSHRSTINVYDSLERDPRGHSLSIVVVLVDPTPSGTGSWVDVEHVGPLAFDHNEILLAARSWLAVHLWLDQSLLRSLLGARTLTTASVIELVEAIDGTAADASNVRRKLVSSGLVEPTTDVARHPGRGRPSAVWAWR